MCDFQKSIKLIFCYLRGQDRRDGVWIMKGIRRLQFFFNLNVGHIAVTWCAFLFAYCETVNVHFKRKSQIVKKNYSPNIESLMHVCCGVQTSCCIFKDLTIFLTFLIFLLAPHRHHPTYPIKAAIF